MADGCQRSSIYRGLRVAVVLKEDQPTGRRTQGEVAQILTPGDYHPRGIKVRLKDGQVGRVQEILGPPVKKAPPLKIIGLAVLLIEQPDGSLYARKLKLPSGELLTVLGLDKHILQNQAAESIIRALYGCVSEALSGPEALLSANVEIQDQQVQLTAFVCRGQIVRDDQQAQWDWTGWLSREEAEKLSAQGELSDESALLLQQLGKQSRP